MMARHTGDVRAAGRRGLAAGGGLILALLIVVAIILLLYFVRTGKDGTSYIQETIRAKQTAKLRAAETELAGLYKEIQMHAVVHDGRYPSFSDLLANTNYGKLLSAPSGEEPLCRYIESQNEQMPGDNVLVYETDVPEDGSGLALLRDGQVVSYGGEQMKQAVERTQARLGR